MTRPCRTSLPVIQFLLSSPFLFHHPRHQPPLPPSTPSGRPESVCLVPSAAHLPSSSLPLPSLELLVSGNRLSPPESSARQHRALSPLGRKGRGRMASSVAHAAEVGALRTSGSPTHTHTPHHVSFGETKAKREGDSSKVQSPLGSKSVGCRCSLPLPVMPPPCSPAKTTQSP